MLEQIISTAKYLGRATDYQDTSNQKLATALKVTTQVTEQLHNGTTAATLAAKQLGDVVKELRRPVNNPTNNGRSCGANASRLQMRQLLKASLVLSRCSPISQCLGAVA